MLLSILVCRLKKREEQYKRLMEILEPQMTPEIEVLFLEDNGEQPVGVKRNSLILSATGKYICFIDDDDRISENYIDQVIRGIKLGVDCCSLVGEITTNGKDPKIFVHSIEHKEYYEKDGVYYRPPNHLNVIKKSIAEKFFFPPKDFGEDTDWAMQICKAGVLKTEHKVKRTIYYYDYITEKS